MLSNASPAELDTILNQIGASVAVLDPEANGLVYAAANELHAAMVPGAPDRLVGRRLAEVLPRYVATDFEAHLRTCLAEGTSLEFEHVMDQRGAVTWWRNIASPVLGADGRAARVFVTSIDITEKRRLEEDVRENRDRLAAIISATADGIVSVDLQRRITFANPAAESMFGHAPGEMVGLELIRLVPARFHAVHDGYVDAFSRSPVRSREMQERTALRGVRKDGREFPVQITIAKFPLHSGLEMTAIVRDISETQRLIEELNVRATTDSLTGASNRQQLLDRLETEVTRARRHKRPLAVLMLDIDHFKTINDTHGHAVGDEVIRALVHTIDPTLRASDMLGRLGGEEFGIMLPETALAGALEVAQRLRALVAEVEVNGAGQTVRFTVSIGVACMLDEMRTADDLLRAADGAMYEAKHAGRNTVRG